MLRLLKAKLIMSLINNTSVTIDTVVPTLSIGQIQLSADRRSTKEKPLTDAERIRRAVLPANHWGNYSATIEGTANQSLTDVLRTKLVEIASDRLRDTLAATPDARTISLADYTITSLLAWSMETASSRGSITFTRDQAQDWFDRSETAKGMVAKHGAAKGVAILQYLRNRFGALAAKNHGLKDEAEALKLVSIIADEDTTGTDAALVTEITARLAHIAKALAAKANEATVSMDDI